MTWRMWKIMSSSFYFSTKKSFKINAVPRLNLIRMNEIRNTINFENTESYCGMIWSQIADIKCALVLSEMVNCFSDFVPLNMNKPAPLIRSNLRSQKIFKNSATRSPSFCVSFIDEIDYDYIAKGAVVSGLRSASGIIAKLILL
jgi:hypothetical protein